MNMLSFEAKTIIFVIAFILLGIIGLVIDNMWDNKQCYKLGIKGS